MSHRAFLGLVAVGAVDPAIVRRLRTAVAKILAVPARVLRPLSLPEKTFHIARGQYHSTQILEYLLSEHNSGAFRILGITSIDLYIPILTFVFGEAQLDGQAAVISLFRPRGDADGTYPPPAVVLNRLIKLSIHELGHTFGLGHCRQENCLMGFSANLEKLDQKNLTLCHYCQVLLADFYQEHQISSRLTRNEGTPSPGVAIPTAENGHRHRQ
jgi:archaemetzincin